MKKAVLAAFAAAFAARGFCEVPDEKATPESQGVSSRAVLDWIDACEKKLKYMHGFVIRRHGKVIAEGSWKPFDTLNETHMLYSHSKSFVSTAIGMLTEEKKLDLDERVADIFPDKLPPNAGENLREVRIRDLLTMNFGAAPDHQLRSAGGDWAATALAKKIEHRPGTFFRYDSDATYLLSAAIMRRSGQTVMEYLKPRLFGPIGIEKAWSTCSPQGIPCGGWGMNMTTREISRFGQWLLNEGAWNGRQLVSRDWVRLATAKQTRSGWGGRHMEDHPESDWYQGYCFQFWRCRHNCYRADGADGQYTIVMPEQDAVVSLHAGLDDLALEQNLVWEHLLPAMGKAPLAENAELSAKLSERCASLAIAPVAGSAEGGAWLPGATVAFPENKRGYRHVRFEKAPGGWTCRMATPAGEFEFPVGYGEWRKGFVTIDPGGVECLNMIIGRQPIASSAAFDENGDFVFRAHLTGTTTGMDFKLTATGGKARVTGTVCKTVFK